MEPQLTHSQMEFWRTNGYLVLKDFLSPAEKNALVEWTNDLENWPESPGQWMKYFERPNPDRRLLCRVENFIPFHSALSEFLLDKRKIKIISQLMGEEAILFKEKINFKLPGGKGFAPHQDAPAYVSFGHTYHVTMMISVDPTTTQNGCLDVVNGLSCRKILPQKNDGTLDSKVIDSLTWTPLTTDAGDVVFFDSYLPHGSGPNQSTSPRRAYYITYNKQSEGDYREQYYAQKRRDFPPECEREPGVDYSKKVSIFNLGNPID